MFRSPYESYFAAVHNALSKIGQCFIANRLLLLLLLLLLLSLLNFNETKSTLLHKSPVKDSIPLKPTDFQITTKSLKERVQKSYLE